VISPAFGCDLEFGFIQQKLTSPPFSQSELDGLNLNITVPVGTSALKKLPVFIFIHGGGFWIGGNSWPQYDLAKLVQLSIDLGQPIIGINIKLGCT
jgi:carboxylesterase type B